jgi:hypothetical protein
MTKLASTTVGVTAQSSISFTNIPQGYTDLVIKVSGRTAAPQGACNLSFNSVTTNLSSRIIYGIGSGSAGSASYASDLRAGYIVGTDYTASIFSNNEIYISNYSSSNFKSVTVDSVTETNATEAYSMLTSGLWSNPSPITSLSLTVIYNANGAASTFTQHSTFTLYGVKNAAQTAGNSIKATGGNIVFDGTYVYHVYPSSGTFTPTQPILADCLIIGGGAGGAKNGGGGAGVLTYSATNSLITTSYTVTVGAGGAGSGTTSAGIGTSGGESSVNLVSSAGGTGGRGVSAATDPLKGGDSGIYTGGAGAAATIYRGGGGGAGTAGNGTTGLAVGSSGLNTGGIGGIGSNAYSSWASATGTGVSGYYASGGGGGGGYSTGFNSAGGSASSGGGGAGGAGGGNTAVSGTVGTANTGGGGGGGGVGGVTDGSGVAGGSGLVIIRYKG